MLILQIAAGVALGIVLGVSLFVMLATGRVGEVVRIALSLAGTLIVCALLYLAFMEPNGGVARWVVGVVVVPITVIVVAVVQFHFHRAEDWWRARISAWWRRS